MYRDVMYSITVCVCTGALVYANQDCLLTAPTHTV